MRVGLVVDSACDLPKDYIERHAIEILPISVRIDDVVQVDHRDEEATLGFLHSHIAERGASAETIPFTVEQIRDLNPQFLRGIGAAPVRGSSEVTLRVPDGAGERLMESLADGSLVLPTVATPADPAVLRHKVRRGESLKAIALRYGVPASKIARANKIGKSGRLKVGRTLRIPMGNSGGGSERVASSGSDSGKKGAATTVRVKRGQTLSGIAASHGVSVAQLRKANGMSSRDELLAGQRLKIPRPS